MLFLTFFVLKKYALLRWLFSMHIKRSMYVYERHIGWFIYMPFSLSFKFIQSIMKGTLMQI